MEKIYELLYEIRPENDFKESLNYIEDHLLDSLDIISLIALINEKYNIEVNPDDIVPENFIDAESISNMIKKYSS